MHPCFGSNTPLPDSSTKRGHLFQHRPTAPPPHLRPTGRSLPFSRTGACPPTTRPGLVIQNQLPNQLGHSLRARGKACPENTVSGVTVQLYSITGEWCEALLLRVQFRACLGARTETGGLERACRC